MSRFGCAIQEVAREVAENASCAETLRAANERFELAAAAIGGAIYDWDIRAGRVVWSEGLARVFGHRASERSSTVRWWESRIHPEDRARTRRQLAADLAAGRDFVCEYRFRNGAGRYLNVLDRGRPLRDAQGRAVRLVGVREDITALRRSAAQHLRAQRMEAVGRLAGGVAHDFNNLLTTILGYSEILATSLEPSDPRRQDIDEIRKAGERASGLTRELLAFSSRLPGSPRLLDIRAVLSALETPLRELIGAEIVLETRLPAGGLCVWADRAQLDQVVINVAVNARDAMPNGGTLVLSASEVDLDAVFVRGHLGSRAGRHVLMAFRDTGTGMGAETLGRICEPFFTTKEVGKGTGLGMSIVYGFVAQSGGYLAVESSPGEGTGVHIYLPVAAGDLESQHAPPAL